MNVKTVHLCDIACNSYILTDEKSGDIAVIDPAFFLPELSALIEPIKQRVKYILLTHRHFDHVLGAAGIKQMCPDAKTAVHALDADGLRSKEASLYNMFKDAVPHDQTLIEPDILLSDGDEITLGSVKLRVMHTPGHTAGSIMYISDGVIFSGDTLFDGSIGRTDLPSGSMHDMRMSLRAIRKMTGDYIVYTGHGGTTTLKNEQKFNSYMGS